jgi:hypothetical protein
VFCVKDYSEALLFLFLHKKQKQKAGTKSLTPTTENVFFTTGFVCWGHAQIILLIVEFQEIVCEKFRHILNFRDGRCELGNR